ncbi:MAG: hypothetical protein HC838_15445 [Spirulinaceae cyanobacterium RM2_2_10]|nr:hypothetical protein [Spirulinaceae cyanobacterium RM2_2_10]
MPSGALYDMNTAQPDPDLTSLLSQLLLTHTEPQPLLNAAAESLGDYLGSDACLLASDPATTGIWCAETLTKSAATGDRPVTSQPCCVAAGDQHPAAATLAAAFAAGCGGLAGGQACSR